MKIFFFKIWTLLLFLPLLATANETSSCSDYESRMESLIRGEFDLEEAELMYESYLLKDCANKLLAYNFIGFAHYNASQLDKAKEFLLLAEEQFFENDKKVDQYAKTQIYTALVLMIEKDFESAIYHLKKAEEYAKKGKDLFVRSSVYQNLGLAKLKMEEFEASEQYYIQAIDQGGLDSLDIGYIYQNLALLHSKREKTEKAAAYVEKTKRVWSDLGFNKGKYFLSFIEAELAMKKKDYGNALDFIKKGRESYKNEEKLLLGENYLVEAEIHAALGNGQEQRVALEYAITESDDLSEEQLKGAIDNLSLIQNSKYTNELLVGLVTKLKKENKNQKNINTARSKIIDTKIAEDESLMKRQLISILVLGSLFLLLTFLWLRIRRQNQDITELNQNLKLSHQKIEKQVESLQAKNKALEQFAYVASHDLKSPLRTISSFAGLMKRKHGSDENIEYLDIINQSAKDMTQMISDLLDHSTLDQELNIQNVILTELIKDTTRRIEAQIQESSAVIKVDESCDMTIHCDKTMANVFQNLITNAINYSKEDTAPVISISASKDRDNYTIKVADNGIGIDKAYHGQVFEMFKRLKEKRVSGTGIGLASCKKILDNHGGDISLESSPGEGAIFTLKLPIKRAI